MKTINYICNLCNQPKGATNHWYWVKQTDTQLSFHTWDPVKGPPKSAAMHLCGDACCGKVLQQWLTERKGGTL